MSTSKNYFYKILKVLGIIAMLINGIIYVLGVYIALPLAGIIITFIITVLALNLDIQDNLLNKLTIDERKWFHTIENTTIKIENETCQTFKLNQNILDTNKPIVSYNKFSSSEYWIDANIIDSELSQFNGFISALDKITYKKDIDSLWIFARGYSDKSNMENKEYHLNDKYSDTSIDYYPSIYGEYFKIDDNVSKRLIIQNSTYTNKDLIYLRANFVAEVYFKKLLKQLDYKNYHLKILEGKSFDVRNESLRKVEVYISFCRKNENLSVWDNFLIFIKELRLIFFSK